MDCASVGSLAGSDVTINRGYIRLACDRSDRFVKGIMSAFVIPAGKEPYFCRSV